MTKFDEVRPLEGLDTPIAARLKLRQMFKRWLWRLHHVRFVLEHEEVIDELFLLELSQHYRLEYSGATENSIKMCNESKQRVADGDSTFEDLVHIGWVKCKASRISACTVCCKMKLPLYLRSPKNHSQIALL